VNPAAQEGAGGDDDSVRAETTAFKRLDAEHRGRLVVEKETGDRALNAAKGSMLFQQRADSAAIHAAITLRSWRPHGSTLPAVEHAELQRREICRTTHDPAERVDFADYSAFRDAANSRITRHLPNTLERARYEPNTGAEAGGSNGGLGTGVPGTDHNDIERFLKRLGGVDERHAQSYCRVSERGSNLPRAPHPNHSSRATGTNTMAQEIPSGQAMLFIKRDAYERVGLTRAAIDQRLNLTPDEFRVEGALVMVGPLPDDTGLRDLFDELEETGLVYFDDYFELSGNWPAWLRLFVDSR
jgi:hypothetical protein